MIWRGLLIGALCVVAASCGQSPSIVDQIEREDAAAAVDLDRAAQEAQTYMVQQRRQPGIEALPSGVLYQFNRRGSNQRLPHPSAQAVVRVHYEGRFTDNEVFDSSIQRGQPAVFPLQDVVPGFREAILQMRPGDELTAYIPPALGYGPTADQGMRPNAVLIFRIQLIEYRNPNGPMVSAPR